MSEEWKDLGHEHYMRMRAYKGDPNALVDYKHPRKDDGSPCRGCVTIEGSSWANEFENIAAWKLVDPNMETLTLTPSLLCRVCGDHGFIQNGKWVPV